MLALLSRCLVIAYLPIFFRQQHLKFFKSHQICSCNHVHAFTSAPSSAGPLKYSTPYDGATIHMEALLVRSEEYFDITPRPSPSFRPTTPERLSLSSSSLASPLDNP